MTFNVHTPNEITFSLVLHSNNFIADRTFPREIIVTFYEFVPTKPCWIKLAFVLLWLRPFSLGWPRWSSRWLTIFIVSQITIWRICCGIKLVQPLDSGATPTTSYSGMALFTPLLGTYISAQTVWGNQTTQNLRAGDFNGKNKPKSALVRENHWNAWGNIYAGGCAGD